MPFNCRFFLSRFSVCFNCFVLLFLVTPCLLDILNVLALLVYLSSDFNHTMYFNSNTVCTYVCWFNELPPGFIFWIHELTDLRGRKERETFSECFTHGLGQTLMKCILIKSSPKSLTQKNQNCFELFFSNVAILYESLKWQGVNHSYLNYLSDNSCKSLIHM